MECVTSTQGSPFATAAHRVFCFFVFFPMLCQLASKTLAVLLPSLTNKTPPPQQNILYVFERRKITFKADDLCCVPVLNNSGGPTYWGPLDSSAIVGIARGWHAFVLQDNDYRSLGNGKKKTNFLLSQVKSLQKLRTRAGSLTIPRYASHASLQPDLVHASALARQLTSHLHQWNAALFKAQLGLLLEVKWPRVVFSLPSTRVKEPPSLDGSALEAGLSTGTCAFTVSLCTAGCFCHFICLNLWHNSHLLQPPRRCQDRHLPTPGRLHLLAALISVQVGAENPACVCSHVNQGWLTFAYIIQVHATINRPYFIHLKNVGRNMMCFM